MKNKLKNFFKDRQSLSIFLCIVSFVTFILLDQLTKGLLIPKVIPDVGDMQKVIPGFISFVFVKNYGAAWGIFQNNNIFLIIASILGILLVGVFYLLRVMRAGQKSSRLFALAAGFIISGALGNLIDRIAFGYVRDFINFDFISFPVFNFADIALTFGIIMLLIYILFYYSKECPDEEGVFKISKNKEKSAKNNEKTDEKPEKIEEKDQLSQNENVKKDKFDEEDESENDMR